MSRKLNTDPTHFLTLMNNDKAFSSLDGKAGSYQCSDQFQFLPRRTLTSQGLRVLETLQIQLIYLKMILITSGIIWILKFKTKTEWWNCGITNTNIKSTGGFFPKKKLLMREQKKFLGKKNYGEVALNWRTNDQIMPGFGRSFANDKCIFH